MSLLKKIKQFLGLDPALLSKIEKNINDLKKNGFPLIKFWIYAESMGEFRFALALSEAVKKVLKNKPGAKNPLFFISFKTKSTLDLARGLVDKKNGLSSVIYSFHSSVYAPIFSPDYFISVEHPVSRLLVKRLLKSNSRLFFTGLNLSENNKFLKFLKRTVEKARFQKSNINLTASTVHEIESAERKIPGLSRALKFEILPGKFKFNEIFENEIPKNFPSFGGNNIVLSFVSTHRKESLFLIKLISKITAEKPRINFKFFMAPRNVGISRYILAKSKALGLSPVFMKNINTPEVDFIYNNKYNLLIVDSYGILDKIYPLSDIVFIGKSLFEDEKGGHNIIEPASFGKAIITGSHADNFKEIVSEMIKYNAIDVACPENLKAVIYNLIDNPELRAEKGLNALKYYIEKRDFARKNLFKYISRVLSEE